MTSSIPWILRQKTLLFRHVSESAFHLEKAGHIQTQEAPSGIGIFTNSCFTRYKKSLGIKLLGNLANAHEIIHVNVSDRLSCRSLKNLTEPNLPGLPTTKANPCTFQPPQHPLFRHTCGWYLAPSQRCSTPRANFGPVKGFPARWM